MQSALQSYAHDFIQSDTSELVWERPTVTLHCDIYSFSGASYRKLAGLRKTRQEKLLGKR